MATLTFREYHPESGMLLGNVSVLNFGKVKSGGHTRVKVVDIVFGDVDAVSNVRLGIVANGGITVNPNPQDIAEDGSSSNGQFGVQSSPDFNATIASAPLKRHFPGVNSSVSGGDPNNVIVGNRDDLTSNYIYLDVDIGSSKNKPANGGYKVFFDVS